MTELRGRPVPDSATGLPPLPRRDPITNLPIVVLYVHSRCNCRCEMCDIWRVNERREIGAAEVRAWLPEFTRLGVRRVVLSGGEPLMHSDLWGVCEALRSAGIGVTVLTTGLLLRRFAGDLVRYCDDVIVSVDGPPEVHDRIRNVPGGFAKIVEGVRAVKAADAGVTVSGRCTVQQLNFRHLRGTVASAHEMGLNRISFLAVDVATEAFNRPGSWTVERARGVALDATDLPLLAEEIAALERDCTADIASGYISEPPEKLRRRLLQYFTALVGTGDFAPIDCNAPWVSTVIETDGTVRPCFFQPPLGNVREAGSLHAVLNSPSAVAWRRGLDTRRNAICRKCVCSISLRAPSESVNAV